MKLVLAVILFSCASLAGAQPYLVAGATALRVQAQGMHDSTALLALGAGHRIGAFAGEAFYAGASDYGAALLGHVPLGAHVSFFGRLAAHHLKGDVSEPVPDGTGSPLGPVGTLSNAGTFTTRTASWSGWTPAIGVGIQLMSPRPGLGGRLLLEQTRGLDQLERARLLSVSLLYSF